jgi:DNA-binding transcriptional LysR family regulator
MDFDQLVTFIEVAKLNSFSRAANKIFRSQPAVSAQIQQLEQECGAKLLERNSKSVALTDAGELFLSYAERLLELKKEGIRAVSDQGDTPRGTLAVGANEATCLYVLPQVFAEYLRLYPQVQLCIVRNFTSKVLEGLEDGAIDVGVVTLPVKSQKLTVKPIFRDRLVLMVPAKSPLAKKRSVPVSVAAEQMLLVPNSGYTRQILDRLFRPYAPHLQVRMELPSVEMIKSFVAAGLGVSIISESFARDEVKAGKVKLLPLEDVELYRELGVAYMPRMLPRSAKAFIEVIENRTAEKGSAKSAAAEK